MSNRGLLYENKYVDTELLTSELLSSKRKSEWRQYIDEDRERERKRAELEYSQKVQKKSQEFEDLSDLTSTHGFITDPFSNNLLIKEDERKHIMNHLNIQQTDTSSRYNKPRRSVVTIDSMDRNEYEFPNPNMYTIRLNKAYTNIKSIKLISTEFPNTNQVIKSTPLELATNKLFWINEEDIGVYSTQPVYMAELTPGNYYSSSLVSEIETQLNLIPRNNGTGKLHNFAVSISTDSDIVRFQSLDTDIANNPLRIYGDQILGASDDGFGSMNIITQDTHNLIVGDKVFIQAVRTNPDVNGDRTVRTITGSDSFTIDNGLGSDVAYVDSSDATNSFFSSNILQVNHPGHTFVTGDSVIISNATAFDGLSSVTINGAHTVRAVPASTVDRYYITLNKSGTSLVTGGGTSVELSKTLPFKFLFSNLDTPGDILGFPQNDSSEHIIDPIVVSAGSPATVVSSDHHLQVGDIVEIQDVTTIPALQGMHRISRVVDTNTVELSINIHRVIDGNGYYAFNPFSIVKYNISSITTGQTAVVTTTAAHELSVGDYITLFNTTTEPVINQISYKVTAVPSATSVTINTKVNTVTSTLNSTIAVNRLNVHFTAHSLTLNDTLYVYGSKAYAGLSPDHINTVHGKQLVFNQTLRQPKGKSEDNPQEKRNTIIQPSELETTRFVTKVQDANHFQINISRSPTVDTSNYGGGNDVCISSALFISLNRTIDYTKQIDNLYGFSYIQENIDCNGFLNRSVSMEGDRYILVLNEMLSTMENSGPVTNVFAKILLSDTPGSMMFNTFVSNEKTFDDTPLPILTELSFVFVDNRGRLFDFTGIEHSFSLEIMEYVDYLEDANVGSQRGVTDRGRSEEISRGGSIQKTSNFPRGRDVVNKPV